MRPCWALTFAVVCPVVAPLTRAASITATRRPALLSNRAVVNPAIPASSTAMSTSMGASSGAKPGSSVVAIQTDWCAGMGLSVSVADCQVCASASVTASAARWPEIAAPSIVARNGWRV
jgi:hypothetical protein